MKLPFKFHQLPRKQGKTKMACGLLKKSVEKKKKSKDIEMDSVELRHFKCQFLFPLRSTL